MRQVQSKDNVKRDRCDMKQLTKKVKSPPISAYALRKEHKRLLMEQAENMQYELDKLKFRHLVKQGQIGKDTKRTAVENSVLHEYIQKQHLTLAATQAAITGHVHQSLGAQQPVQSVIYLGKDQLDRYRTLLTLKERKLYEAERYLNMRSHGLENMANYCQNESYDTVDGDNCAIRFEIKRLAGTTVKVVHSAILNTIVNAEMFLSELFGSITIREDNNDSLKDEMTQLRLLSLTSTGATVESNTVVFSKLVDGVDGEYGIVALDFVDRDELHPYRSKERVRRDTTTVIMVRALPLTNGLPGVVVMRRSFLKVHRSSTNGFRKPETEMMESSVCWGDTASKCVEHQLKKDGNRESSLALYM
ncbi:hypothetical protein Plhal304r1_c046g0127941 [Plasmopara halstedii]